MVKLALDGVPSPAYLTDMAALRRNLEIVASVKEAAGCTIVLALKAFAQTSTFPLIAEYLDGTTASGLNEAMLGHSHFGKGVHVYSPAYSESEFDALLPISSHISFNTMAQWARFKEKASGSKVKFGLRVNPEKSAATTALYDPCAPCSRLGTKLKDINESALEGLSGLHVHALCENMAEDSAALIDHVADTFGELIKRHNMTWVNFGGGHYMTHANYKRELLIDAVKRFQDRFGLKVILEPGGAVVYQAGYLVATVLDVVPNEPPVVVLDTSATAHMPDVLEMPYRPNIIDTGEAGEKPHLYTLGGNTCLAGDVIGDYSFDAPLAIGQKLIFTDMAQYSMVKNSTFNGIPLPQIGRIKEDGSIVVDTDYGYQDFARRVG